MPVGTQVGTYNLPTYLSCRLDQKFESYARTNIIYTNFIQTYKAKSPQLPLRSSFDLTPSVNLEFTTCGKIQNFDTPKHDLKKVVLENTKRRVSFSWHVWSLLPELMKKWVRTSNIYLPAIVGVLLINRSWSLKQVTVLWRYKYLYYYLFCGFTQYPGICLEKSSINYATR